jgi:aminoglycoside 6'-N-acetyltransferase I
MKIEKAQERHLNAITKLALQLWPAHDYEELRQEMGETLSQPDAAFFLAFDGETPVGFAQCQLRRDYVEGTESSPVGYLEGIFVAEDYRRRGIARALLRACENWSKEQGCTEFASDCELTNTDSLMFHLKLGFLEANRIICFTTKL